MSEKEFQNYYSKYHQIKEETPSIDSSSKTYQELKQECQNEMQVLKQIAATPQDVLNFEDNDDESIKYLKVFKPMWQQYQALQKYGEFDENDFAFNPQDLSLYQDYYLKIKKKIEQEELE
ncbi:hypothetical protein LFWB_6760 [Candidatus Phytoplasma luffae]|uniref:Type I restriction enzyme R protein C-terminal domain-containing protein n=1 Tax=Loofah witches'-broom phytoplasma TaxID=35773 RepID=A0A975IM80_LOWBP|nr:hypothetical protein [Candidatus Phytoplasma luffae]QTX03232.1 hypothetical protein LFWB_6760 [Candidatus Phytoplasma luffae]